MMRRFVLIGTFCLWPGVAFAQQSAGSPPTFRTTVSEVTLDLIVRDAHGRAVKNLQPSEVEVYENGVKQQVRSLRLMAGREASSPGVSSGASAPFLPLHANNLVCLVFHDMNNGTRRFTLEAAREFVAHPLSPNTYVGVFSLDSGMRPLVAFTNNRDKLMEAAKRAFVGRQVDFASSVAVLSAGQGVVSVNSDLPGIGINTLAVAGADVATGPAADTMRGDLAQSRRQFIGIEGARAMDQMNEMIRMLGQLPGRKTVLLLSPGLTTTGDPDKFKTIVDAANRAAISVYAIDTNGMAANSPALAASSLMSAQPGTTMEDMHVDDYRYDAVRTSNPQAPLRALAEGTGGFLAANTNDLRKSFERIVEDVSTHYEVTYHPTDDKFDGRYRRVEVRLARTELTAETRHGYFALPDVGGAAPAPYEAAALTALDSGSKSHAFEFHTAAYQFRSDDAASQYVFAFEVPAFGLTATPLAEQKKQRLHIGLLALVKDADGRVVDKISQDFPFEFADSQIAAVRTDAFRYHRTVELPAGHYSLETAVVDRESNRTATESVEFGAGSTKGLAISNLLLVRSIEALKTRSDKSDPFELEDKLVTPELGATLKTGVRPYVYFVVYPNKANAGEPRLQVEVLGNGSPLKNETSRLPPANGGAVPMIVGGPAQPGTYELRITAIQGSESVERQLTYVIPQAP